ncbi:hypothetical protein BSKO_11206 [Bryopsis sp. KO-2023]|nr:hypothetical protein BSKO_11206 [Bryopsis sp. KO-2023]
MVYRVEYFFLLAFYAILSFTNGAPVFEGGSQVQFFDTVNVIDGKRCTIRRSPDESRKAGLRCLEADVDNGIGFPGPQAHELMNVQDLPQSFFWGNVDGVNYLTESRNQHLPEYCGSCWAFASTSVLSDRIKIKRRAEFPDIRLSPQVLLNCNGGGSCHGGYPQGVFNYMHKFGLPEETCQNYMASERECHPHGICEKCSPNQDGSSEGKNCTAIKTHTSFTVDSFGRSGYGYDRANYGHWSGNSDRLKAEIFMNGPIVCAIYATQGFDNYTGGVFQDFGYHWSSNHDISVVGWGVDDLGRDVWIGRNSWGTYWGENGFFRILQGSSLYNLGIEKNCAWANPVVPDHLLPKGNNADVHPTQSKIKMKNVVDAPLKSIPEVAVKNGDESKKGDFKMFKQLDIRHWRGVNFATADMNQNSPQYCESSWAHAVVASLNDRFAMMREDRYPEIDISRQVLINCVEGSGCQGGDPAAAFQWILENDVPDVTCSPYLAKEESCNAFNICGNCFPTACWPMLKYPKYSISDHGKVSGEAQMKEELSKYGPIVCGICVSEQFRSYEDGIIKGSGGCEKRSHFVEITGYGRDGKGNPYWIGRNSWGTYWGEHGWFRLAIGEEDLGVAKECFWGRPHLN